MVDRSAKIWDDIFAGLSVLMFILTGVILSLCLRDIGAPTWLRHTLTALVGCGGTVLVIKVLDRKIERQEKRYRDRSEGSRLQVVTCPRCKTTGVHDWFIINGLCYWCQDELVQEARAQEEKAIREREALW